GPRGGGDRRALVPPARAGRDPVGDRTELSGTRAEPTGTARAGIGDNVAGPMLRVLVVDDEKNIRSTLALALEGMGCEVGLAANAEAALAAAAREVYDLALVDLKLAEGSGLDLIPRLVAASPGLEIVVITAYATIDTAVEAMRRGA